MAGLDAPLCEVCGKPVGGGSRPVLVGACEFPFHVHDECREAMDPTAGVIEQMCEWSADQPEGLLWLGSWETPAVSSAPSEEPPGRP